VRAFMALGAAQDAEFGTAYNAGTGMEIEISAVVTMLNELTGNNKAIVSEKARLRPAKSEVRALVADARRLNALSGWRPETDLESGLSQCVDWWRERIASGRLRRDASFAR
jgi:nucleoside-diphosphate-sugar epimerase